MLHLAPRVFYFLFTTNKICQFTVAARLAWRNVFWSVNLQTLFKMKPHTAAIANCKIKPNKNACTLPPLWLLVENMARQDKSMPLQTRPRLNGTADHNADGRLVPLDHVVILTDSQAPGIDVGCLNVQKAACDRSFRKQIACNFFKPSRGFIALKNAGRIFAGENVV